MPSVTAIVHTHNDEQRIARAIESLRPCNEVLVIDHASSDETRTVARRFGARVLPAQVDIVQTGIYLHEAQNDWLLCLHPTECLSEALEASIFEWRLGDHQNQAAFAVAAMEDTGQGWIHSATETRLVNRAFARWQGWKPQAEGVPRILPGYLMRLRFP